MKKARFDADTKCVHILIIELGKFAKSFNLEIFSRLGKIRNLNSVCLSVGSAHAWPSNREVGPNERSGKRSNGRDLASGGGNLNLNQPTELLTVVLSVLSHLPFVV